jgi:hypothetical protein
MKTWHSLVIGNWSLVIRISWVARTIVQQLSVSRSDQPLFAQRSNQIERRDEQITFIKVG